MTTPRDIYFFHIPKTAGTSIGDIIRSAYAPEQHLPAYNPGDLTRLRRDDINRYHCFIGHFGTALFSVLDRAVPCVTILRDPFEQSVSHIQHSGRLDREKRRLLYELYTMIRKLGDRHYESAGPRWKRVWEYLYRGMVHDYQTRQLGVDIDLNPRMGANNTSSITQLVYDCQGDQPIEEIFERAKRRLDSMAVVGTVERIAETTELLCDFLGIPAPEKPPITNVNPRNAVRQSYRQDGSVSKALTAIIDNNTEYDRQLHAYASQLLDVRLAEMRQRKLASSGAAAPPRS